MEKISRRTCREALSGLPGWALEEGRDAIRKKFVFRGFSEAFGWMTQIALLAEKMDHHPEWLNIWNTVDVSLSTHDAGGVTQKDLDLAKAMDRIFT